MYIIFEQNEAKQENLMLDNIDKSIEICWQINGSSKDKTVGINVHNFVSFV